MGTRSLIGMENQDGSVRYIYCHWDGYPSCVGQKLVNNYGDRDKVSALLDLGNLSSLGAELGEKHDFNDRDCGDVCTAYGRDRDEEGQEATFLTSREEFLNGEIDMWQEFQYLFTKDGEWVFYDTGHSSVAGTERNLAAFLAECKEEEAA